MEANLCNIQKFSLHDGPGIRTTVFFKGCPLRCAWCANPESQERALGPGGQEEGLALGGEARTLEEVLCACLQDQPFYEESGGGVTLSGGEPLAQPAFCRALLQKLKARGVHTAVETTGCVPGKVFQDVAPCVDLFLYDVKHWDGERHQAGTGVGNGQILENLAWAVRAGKAVLPRIPVIPGYNDSLEDAAGFCARLREAGARRAQLLPFHQFGEKKYQLLGKPYRFAGVAALYPEDLEPYRQAFLSGGIEAFF